MDCEESEIDVDQLEDATEATVVREDASVCHATQATGTDAQPLTDNAPLRKNVSIAELLPAVGKDGRFLRSCNSGLKYASKEALAEALQTTENASILLIDMRQSYEFVGGHIRGAVNVNWRAEDHDRKLHRALCTTKFEVIIVYCEFGGKRSPQAAISATRVLSKSQRADLKSTAVRVLLGGYSNFFSSYHGLCSGGYVPE